MHLFVFLVFIFVTFFLVDCQYYLKTLVGTGSGGSDGDFGPASLASISAPLGIWGVSNGNIYVGEQNRNIVRKIDTAGIITTVIGVSGGPSNLGVGGPALSVSLDGVWGPYGDTIGKYIYVSGYSTFIWRYDLSSGIITRFVGGVPAAQTYSGDGGPATASALRYPQGMFLSSSGILYVADCWNNVIRAINTTSNIITTFAGNNLGAYGGDFGPALAASFRRPFGVWGDSTGNIFITDYDNHRVRKVNTSSIIVTFAGTGNFPFNSDNIPATLANLYGPIDVKGDSRGNVYFSETNGARIRIVSAAGIINTIVGTGTNSPATTNVQLASSASVSDVYGIWVDSNGNLYYTENARHYVRFVYDLTPTAVPSQRPTMEPTFLPSPTVAPTDAPSAIPSETPTAAPSTIPSEIPSTSPSITPSESPSTDPSASPSETPSVFPSTAPSENPSLLPSVEPSQIPSTVPTTSPSEIPSMLPSFDPSHFPSALPTPAPTTSPSVTPSADPSQYPTEMPTVHPSSAPTHSPSVVPSYIPSEIPSTSPTATETDSPSVLPTAVPSTAPTFLPSAIPSAILSDSPTDSSHTPSIAPSASLSVFPTQTPSDLPTVTYTATPSEFPTAVPTTSPSQTLIPSFAPSESPSFMQTAIPTLTPSFNPSTMPTLIPSNNPSVAPSLQDPTYSPSIIPSALPSVPPSSTSSVSPSFVTTQNPSPIPTAAPSNSPSSAPTTVQPTFIQTATPSAAPSTAPSTLPTAKPSTTVPTRLPTTSLAPSIVLSFSSISFKVVLSLFGNYIPSRNPSHPFNLSLTAEGKGTIIFGTPTLRSNALIDATIPLTSSHYPMTRVSGSFIRDTSTRTAVVPGDLDQDGYKDLIVCYPLSSSCYIFFGSADNGMREMKIGARLYASSATFFGFAVAAANDLNQDGYPDVIISALRGKVCYVVYGRPSWNNEMNIADIRSGGKLTEGADGFKILGDSSTSLIGLSLAGVEDMNGDSLPDLAISLQQGSVFIVYLIWGAGERGQDVSLAEVGHGVKGIRVFGEQGYYTGLSISRVGDVNDDGFADVVIGAIPNPGKPGEQRSYVIFGASGAVSDITLGEGVFGKGVVVLSGGGFIVNGPGDLNNDGIDDLMIVDVRDYLGKSNAYIICDPSKMSSPPSFLPSSFPSTPPSSRPSSEPSSSLPTVFPSIHPPPPGAPQTSSNPTTQRPSRNPTARPTAMVSTLLPTAVATTASTSAKPTAIQIRLSPSRAPTLAPSKRPVPPPSLLPTSTNLKPLSAAPSLQPSGLNRIQVEYSIRIVNTTSINKLGVVQGIEGQNEIFAISSMSRDGKRRPGWTGTIIGGTGRKIYRIYPKDPTQPVNRILLKDFASSKDIIDLSLIKGIRSKADLTYLTHPLTLFLPDNQRIVLSSYETMQELSDENFVFEASSNESSTSSPIPVDSSLLTSASVLVIFAIVVLGFVSLLPAEKDVEHLLKEEKEEVEVEIDVEKQLTPDNSPQKMLNYHDDKDVNGGFIHEIGDNNEVQAFEDVAEEVERETEDVNRIEDEQESESSGKEEDEEEFEEQAKVRANSEENSRDNSSASGSEDLGISDVSEFETHFEC